MYFLISFFSSFILCFLFLKNIRRIQTSEFIEQNKKFLQNDEQIIEYTSIRADMEYVISSIVGFICYLISSIFIQNTIVRTLLSDIFHFDFVDLFLFVFFLFFVMIRSINIFSEFLIVSNKTLTYIHKKRLKDKIKYNEIKSIKYYPILPFHIRIMVLSITLKNGTKKIISDFANSRNISLIINRIIRESELEV